MPVSWQTRLFSESAMFVAVDRLEHALARNGSLAAARRIQGVAQILRDVLQRPDVEVRGGVLDRALQIGAEDAHARTAPSISCQRSAIASGSTGSRPKSTSSL